MKVTWSDIAEADLDQLYDYIARDAPYYAEQFIDRIIEAVGMLHDHPQLGRRVPEAESRDDVRELIFQSYRIVYLPRNRAGTNLNCDTGKPRPRRARRETLGDYLEHPSTTENLPPRRPTHQMRRRRNQGRVDRLRHRKVRSAAG